MDYNDNPFFSHRKRHYSPVSNIGSKDVNLHKKITKIEQLEKISKFYKGSIKQNI